ncbi:MAG: tetratricopeptide repeat protein, partial [Candidatus Angelobacter sp.]
MLLLLVAFTSGAVYVGTRAFANENRAIKVKIAAAWYREGEQRLREKHPDEAVTAFRKASVNDHDRQVYALSLAQALQLAGRNNEARELLLQLRESSPENPQINLELARVAAEERNVSEALRYYHSALYGIWTGGDVDARQRKIRRELINFLVAQRALDEALAEVLALAYHLPNTVQSHLELGEMFARVNDPQRAQAEFTAVLQHESRNQIALQ